MTSGTCSVAAPAVRSFAYVEIRLSEGHPLLLDNATFSNHNDGNPLVVVSRSLLLADSLKQRAATMKTARATLFVALLCWASAAHAITIGGITLTDLGAGVVPNAINNNGQVVGQNVSGQAFLWQGGTMASIAMPSGTQSCANAINDNGEVVGWFDNSSGLQHAFSWTSGTATDLSAGQTYTSVANGINSSGNIVGYTETGSSPVSEEWGSQGSRSLFPTKDTESFGINNSGWVVGLTTASNGQLTGGFLWEGGSTGNVTGGFSSFDPVAINNNNLLAGQDSGLGAYWSSADGYEWIGKLSQSDPTSDVLGLNSNADPYLVGYSGSQACLFDPGIGQLYNLNDYLPTGSPFTSLTAANDINNSDEFIGIGLVDGVEHGFVGQIVVPEPSTLTLLAIGSLIAFAYGCWRCREASQKTVVQCVANQHTG